MVEFKMPKETKGRNVKENMPKDNSKEYLKAIIVLLVAILIVLVFKENNVEVKVNQDRDVLILPSENMIKNSNPYKYTEVILSEEIVEEIKSEFIKNYPKEMMICLRGHVKNSTYLIEGFDGYEIWKQDEHQVAGICENLTIIKMHTHTSQNYEECSPSYYDLSLENDIEGIMCGMKNPERIVFYDSYNNTLILKEKIGNNYIYYGFIDKNKFEVAEVILKN